MASATDGKKQIMFSDKVYRVDYIGHVRATRDQTWFLVDHCIIDFASILVIRVARLDHPASQLCLQLSDGILFECFLHGRANKEVSWHYSSGHNGESLEKRMSKSDKEWSAVGPQILGADNAASSGCGLVAIRGRGYGDANSSAARAGIDVN